MLALILFGPQGSGKGTQGRMLEDLGFHRIDFGHELRKLAEYNQRIRKIIDGGVIVGDEEVIEIMEHLVLPKELPNNIIFDGFPRSVEQAKWLVGLMRNNGFKIATAHLKIDRELATARIAERYEKEGRKDDRPEIATIRLDKFYNEYGPKVIGQLKYGMVQFVEIDASPEPDQVQRILRSIAVQHMVEKDRVASFFTRPEQSFGTVIA